MESKDVSHEGTKPRRGEAGFAGHIRGVGEGGCGVLQSSLTSFPTAQAMSASWNPEVGARQ